MSKNDLINEIISLDADTFAGIDDPGFLAEMSETELAAYLANMEKELE